MRQNRTETQWRNIHEGLLAAVASGSGLNEYLRANKINPSSYQYARKRFKFSKKTTGAGSGSFMKFSAEGSIKIQMPSGLVILVNDASDLQTILKATGDLK